MLGTVEGVYENGKVELREIPPGVSRARVLVTFLPGEEPKPGEMIRFGQFPELLNIPDEEFEAAEWHVEDEADRA